MAQSVFDQVWIADQPTRVKYILPRRKLPGRAIGWFLTLFGSMFIGVGCYAIYDTAVTKSVGDAVQYVVFVIAGLVIFVPSRIWASTRSKIQIDRQVLRYSEHAWPLWWSWSRPIKAVRGFEVESGGAIIDALVGFLFKDKFSVGHRSMGPDESAALCADCRDVPSLTCARGYPAELIGGLVDHMTHAVQSRGLSDLSGVDDPVHTADSPDPPAGSGMTVERTDGGLTIQVPSLGLWRGAPILMIFAVVFLFFSVVATWAIVTGADVEHWLAYVFVVLFWAVGLGMLTGAIQFGKRPAIIDVVADRLLITKATWSGLKQHEFEAHQISGIDVTFSTTVGQTGDELIITTVVNGNTSQLRLFGGRDAGQLRWLTSTLRRALGVEADDGPSSSSIPEGS